MNDRQFEILCASLDEQTHWLRRVREEIEELQELVKAIADTKLAPKTEVES